MVALLQATLGSAPNTAEDGFGIATVATCVLFSAISGMGNVKATPSKGWECVNMSSTSATTTTHMCVLSNAISGMGNVTVSAVQY